MKQRLITMVVWLNLCALVVLAQTPAPSFGTWKLNLEKSKYNPGPPPNSLMAKYEPAEGGVRAVYDGIDPNGKPIHGEFTAKFDGKDYPVIGDPARDTVAVKKIDDYHFAHTFKKNGKVTTSGRTVLSPDGKVRTVTNTGTNAQGQKVNNTAVYDRQ